MKQRKSIIEGCKAERWVRDLWLLFSAVFLAVTFHYAFRHFSCTHPDTHSLLGFTFFARLHVFFMVVCNFGAFLLAVGAAFSFEKDSQDPCSNLADQLTRLRWRFIRVSLRAIWIPVFAASTLALVFGFRGISFAGVFPWVCVTVGPILMSWAIGLRVGLHFRNSKNLVATLAIARFSWVLLFVSFFGMLAAIPMGFWLEGSTIRDIACTNAYRFLELIECIPGGGGLTAFLTALGNAGYITAIFLVLNTVCACLLLVPFRKLGEGDRALRVTVRPQRGMRSWIFWWNAFSGCLGVGVVLAIVFNSMRYLGKSSNLNWLMVVIAYCTVLLVGSYVLAGYALRQGSKRLAHYVVTGEVERFVWHSYSVIVLAVLGAGVVLLFIAFLSGHFSMKQEVFAFFTVFQASFGCAGLALFSRCYAAVSEHPNWCRIDPFHAPGYVYLSMGILFVTPIIAMDLLLVKILNFPGGPPCVVTYWFLMKTIYAFAGLFFTVVLPLMWITCAPRKFFLSSKAGQENI